MSQPRIAEALSGKRVLLTGVTGFVGEALLERILYDLPETTVVVLVRSRGGASATQRVEHLLTKPAFERLRARYEEPGDGKAVDALIGSRITVLEGDLPNVPDLPADLDLVVHCAGEVSFDPPIDEGFATNLHGSLALLDAVKASGSRPHYLHVSTAYVAGRRAGHVAEGSLEHTVDWRAEAAAADRMRIAAEDASRTPERLAEFLREAEREHGHSGNIAVAADADRRRREWVTRRLVDAGRERARTLGWTDCYTFTKAMAERAVEEAVADLPLTVLRPSIIESALVQPYAGWIEGFKMAEPLILAYGRGELPDFPGIPDSTIDIIPIDYVVNATLAAAAHPPDVGSPAYLTICSGARNPLTFRRLYELVRGYFTEHPLEQRDRGAVRVPQWEWPGAERVEQLLRIGERLHKTTDRLVTHLPRSTRTRGWAQSLDRQKRRLEFLRRYFDLYRPYAEAELHFTDSHTLALHQSLHPDDVAAFGFDAADIDWPHYIAGVHTPAVTSTLRALTGGATRAQPSRAPLDGSSTATGRIVAAFDMDGTLLSSNVVESYLWMRLPELSGAARTREVADVARALPRWLLTERRDRGAFLRSVYRRYEGADFEQLLRIVDERVTEIALGRLSAAATRAVREHRAAGHHTVLITGAISPLTRPLAPLFDEIVAAELAVGPDGRCTGFLVQPPLVGEARAAWLRHRAATQGWDLSASYAYADSASDLPLLQAVGHPVAVDPDITLSRVARRHRWPVEGWHAA